MKAPTEWIVEQAVPVMMQTSFRATINQTHIKPLLHLLARDTTSSSLSKHGVQLIDRLAMLPSLECSQLVLKTMMDTSTTMNDRDYIPLAVSSLLGHSLAVVLTQTASFNLMMAENWQSNPTSEDQQNGTALSEYMITAQESKECSGIVHCESLLACMPAEILLMILEQLDHSSLSALRCCSKGWYLFAKDNYIWYRLSVHQLSSSSCSTSPKGQPYDTFQDYRSLKCSALLRSSATQYLWKMLHLSYDNEGISEFVRFVGRILDVSTSQRYSYD